MAVLASAVLVAAGALSLPLLSSPTQTAPASVFASGRSSAQPSLVAGKIAAPGRVEPGSGVIELAVGLIGALKAVYVGEGDVISRGQLLAELDNADQQARVDEAAASLRLREAELDKLMHGARPEERRETAAQLDEAAASLALAQRELERLLPLTRSGVASRQSMDQAQSTLDVAQARHAARQAAAALINAPPRTEDVAMAQANLALARANLAEQRALLAKTQLRSPIDGIVLRRYLRASEVISVQPPTPILEVGDTTRLRVRAEIDETDVARIVVGQRAWATADAYPSRRFGGVVSRIGQRLGRKTVHTDDPTEKLDTKILEVLIDLDAKARLPIGLRVDVIVEPAATAGK
jgi:HlyD family secretion protein